jgi:hypothetical protein
MACQVHRIGKIEVHASSELYHAPRPSSLMKERKVCGAMDCGLFFEYVGETPMHSENAKTMLPHPGRTVGKHCSSANAATRC